MKWISVETSMPDIDSQVLVVHTHDGDRDISIASWNGKLWESLEIDVKNWQGIEGYATMNLSDKEVSHWMPLPSLPD